MTSQHDTQERGAGFRNRRTAPFTMLANAMLRDPALSLKAKGLLGVMLSFPDDWRYYMRQLETLSSDGREAHQNAMKELIAAGYISRKAAQDENGRLSGWAYEVTDERENRQTGKPSDGKPVTTNTDSTKTDRTKKKDGAEPRRAEQPTPIPAESDTSLPPVGNPGQARQKAGITHPPTALEKVPGGDAAARPEDVPLPAPLTALQGFAEAWADWLAYRRKRRLSCLPETLGRQLKMLAAQPDPLAVMEQSITNGWAGLFPLKGAAATRPQTQTQANERFAARMEDTRQAVTGVFDD
ncbi:hypothetical protein DEIPH_ctg011orf0054 [Deinococcus phoenicis]|uniref:Phage replication protein n=1 Tax=Deinococcus phoenicis TaxID=1476583 RepID=A0A016QSY3_9DEIO|nr:hypothetical protein [Deinococcus phoenicis]EYB69086.1 hypothetical protein DEIPH_ctg011orf0054 [Deinococcus phoenicis]